MTLVAYGYGIGLGGIGTGGAVILPPSGVTLDTQALSVLLLDDRRIVNLPEVLEATLRPQVRTAKLQGGLVAELDESPFQVEICE